MVQGNAILSGVVITVIAGGLFAADYVLKEQPHAASPIQESPTPPEPQGTSSSAMSGGQAIASSTSSRGVVKKGVSTKKKAGVDIPSVLGKLQLVTKATNESSFLSFVISGSAVADTSVLLRNNDRAFLFAWIDSDDAKTIFGSLKQALSEQFSGKMTDLVDETKTQESGPPVDVLSFSDPTLSPEKLVFLRIRTRLYEIHVAKNGEAVLQELIQELSR